jgi:hypothetical protein
MGKRFWRRPERRAGQISRQRFRDRGRSSVDAPAVAGVNRRLGGEVADEVMGVDVHAVDAAARAQTDHAPIVARGAASPGLPAVHPLAARGVLVGDERGAARLQQVLLGGEELVVDDQDLPSEAQGREVGKLGERRRSGR